MIDGIHANKFLILMRSKLAAIVVISVVAIIVSFLLGIFFHAMARFPVFAGRGPAPSTSQIIIYLKASNEGWVLFDKPSLAEAIDRGIDGWAKVGFEDRRTYCRAPIFPSRLSESHYISILLIDSDTQMFKHGQEIEHEQEIVIRELVRDYVKNDLGRSKLASLLGHPDADIDRIWLPGVFANGVAVLAAFISIGWLLRLAIYRSYRKYPEWCCAQCGYDLRMSHDRCPECGTVQK